ncbi:MAG: hypothetical protein G8D86_18015 [gamma proteobacterium symbiont of Ctena orbiculata]
MREQLPLQDDEARQAELNLGLGAAGSLSGLSTGALSRAVTRKKREGAGEDSPFKLF